MLPILKDSKGNSYELSTTKPEGKALAIQWGGGKYYARLGTEKTNLNTSSGYVQKEINPLYDFKYSYTDDWFKTPGVWESKGIIHPKNNLGWGLIYRDKWDFNTNNVSNYTIIVFPTLKCSKEYKTTFVVDYHADGMSTVVGVGLAPEFDESFSSCLRYLTPYLSSKDGTGVALEHAQDMNILLPVVPSCSIIAIITSYFLKNGNLTGFHELGYNFFRNNANMGKVFCNDVYNLTYGRLGVSVSFHPTNTNIFYMNPVIVNSTIKAKSQDLSNTTDYDLKWSNFNYFIPFLIIGGAYYTANDEYRGDYFDIISVSLKQEPRAIIT